MRNVLSQAECQHFIDAGERLGLLDVKVDAKYRNMFRVATWGPEVADVVFKRIRPLISDPIIARRPPRRSTMTCSARRKAAGCRST